MTKNTDGSSWTISSHKGEVVRQTFREDYGYPARVPDQYHEYVLTLNDLDSIVYEFARGCTDGQAQFVDFVMSKVLTEGAWADVIADRNFVKFCTRWAELEAYANDPNRRPCQYGFDPIWDGSSDDYEGDDGYYWPFCTNCYKTEEQHCRCGDCETGATHLQWALEAGIVRINRG
jgi:hypothetical protein